MVTLVGCTQCLAAHVMHACLTDQARQETADTIYAASWAVLMSTDVWRLQRARRSHVLSRTTCHSLHVRLVHPCPGPGLPWAPDLLVHDASVPPPVCHETQMAVWRAALLQPGGERGRWPAGPARADALQVPATVAGCRLVLTATLARRCRATQMHHAFGACGQHRGCPAGGCEPELTLRLGRPGHVVYGDDLLPSRPDANLSPTFRNDQEIVTLQQVRACLGSCRVAAMQPDAIGQLNLALFIDRGAALGSSWMIQCQALNAGHACMHACLAIQAPAASIGRVLQLIICRSSDWPKYTVTAAQRTADKLLGGTRLLQRSLSSGGCSSSGTTRAG